MNSYTELNKKLEGYLKKWTNYMKQYQSRWFVYENGSLAYYKTERDVGEVARSLIYLKSCRIVLTGGFGFTILKKNEELMNLKAESKEDFERWLSVIRGGIILSNKSHQSNDSLSSIPNDSPSISEIEICNEKMHYNALTVTENLRQLDTFIHEIETTLLMNYNENNFVRYRESCLDVCQKIKTLRELNSKIAHSVCTLVSDGYALAANAARNRALNYHNISDNLMSNYNINNKDTKDNQNLLKPQKIDPSSDDEFFDVESQTDAFSPDQKSTQPPGVSNKSSPDTDAPSARPISHCRSVSDIPTKTCVANLMRRSTIPHRPTVKISLWNLISNMIGKDLSKVPLPVNFNEPLSMLQRVCESLEHSYLLDKAANCECSFLQMCYVLAYSVSTYSSTAHRTSKPFNPLLGETYEFDRTEDMGWRVICEQVSHHPPVCALHAEGRGWILSETYDVKSKFMAKYLEIEPKGLSQIIFTRTGFKYTWDKVQTAVYNIVFGTLWIDQYGTMTMSNHSTGDTATLQYVPYSVFKSTDHKKVIGFVKDKNGENKYQVMGYWDKYIEIMKLLKKSNSQDPNAVIDRQMIWASHPLPDGADKMYNFSLFTCSLNEIDNSVAPTDTRNRPDQRAMEEGNFDLANALKVKLEENQRQKRKQSLQDAIDAGKADKSTTIEEIQQPVWFKIDESIDHVACNIYTYKGGYWEAKAKSDFSMCRNIFDI